MSEHPTIDIVVNGVVFGTLDPKTLKARAQMDLEEVTGTSGMFAWLVNHAQMDPEKVPQMRELLADMPIVAIMELGKSIGEALKTCVTIPKANKSR